MPEKIPQSSPKQQGFVSRVAENTIGTAMVSKIIYFI